MRNIIVVFVVLFLVVATMTAVQYKNTLTALKDYSNSNEQYLKWENISPQVKSAFDESYDKESLLAQGAQYLYQTH